MKTAVCRILRGKERDFNRRFEELASHYLFEPVACTPAAGWEKGQVENQVRVVRRRFFTPRIKVNNFKELNEQLRSQCLGWAKTQKHPTMKDKTVWQVYEQERPYLSKVLQPFDGYGERPARVSPSSLVTFDNNRYSVECSHVGQAVQLRAYADKVVIVSDGNVIGVHEREFGRGKTVFDPWHYLPVLERKPGALRNGAPFKGWELPEALTRIRNVLERRYADWDRQFVAILTAVPLYGIETVTWACQEAISADTVSKEVVLNIVSRSQDEHSAAVIDPPAHLKLKHEPVSDCRRYDSLLREARYAAQ